MIDHRKIKMNAITTQTEKTEKTAKPANYTAEQTTKMIADYEASGKTPESVEMIAKELGKSVRSIVAKLSREKVYIKKEYTTKKGETPIKKDETADAIGKVLNLSEPETESLTKANKTALVKIFAALANSVPMTPENSPAQ